MKYIKWIIALALGGVAGFVYWYFVGCNAGSCAITSSPMNSSIYGALMGVLLVNSFSRDKKNAVDQESD
ncbi:MAG TPA: DUF6132 family protein [Chryseosolibacter sp.]